ncbi:hypothetical protein SAY86_008555 [Trapa natans]|uniref:Ubiquitin-like protease family profile domain-containing protein n=1 Tax=Trapa natans TaxID=22666 RepID=A0AAN7KFK7_TRANT|nr:hypothetical protein SAY86_008555 [Trapa natans]
MGKVEMDGNRPISLDWAALLGDSMIRCPSRSSLRGRFECMAMLIHRAAFLGNWVRLLCLRMKKNAALLDQLRKLLRAPLSSRGINDHLFFNAYFYNKLQEAVLCKEIVKDASFTKFRRWWKGVNIFQKDYVFIPINTRGVSHSIGCWKLLGGLVIARQLFIYAGEIFIAEEWNHLKEEVTASNLLIADEFWEVPPHHLISERKITNHFSIFPVGFLFHRDIFLQCLNKRMTMTVVSLLLKELKKAAAGDCDTPDSSPRSKSGPPESAENME